MRVMQLLRQAQQLAPGDFSHIASDYARFQPEYATAVLQDLLHHVGAPAPDFVAADIGAGTGIWSRQLQAAGVRCFCIEPNEPMRQLGAAQANETAVWLNGTAEDTTLPTASVNWITVAAAFHWLHHDRAMAEFARILKPKGYLTLLRHPLAKEQDGVVTAVSDCIDSYLPAKPPKEKKHQQATETLQANPAFGNLHYLEAQHLHPLNTAAYLAVVASLPQATHLFAKLQLLLKATSQLTIAYQTQAWTVQKVA
ncbi:MAG: class I SAM-dependent methyltransferase [Anaerolineales bacterium]|nr:class I SAM-dependent methyltransferase [Anaerolineales bacterium]